MMNLDGDNLLGPRYVKALCSLLPSVNADDSVGARRGAQGTTGRVGMWATHFIRMGGYDESYLPTGYQDVCLHQRVRYLGGSCRTIQGEDLGLSIPNDLGNERVSLGPAKMANIDPHKKNMSWSKMNTLNVNDGHEKLEHGRWRRNMDDKNDCATHRFGPLSEKSVSYVLGIIGAKYILVDHHGLPPSVAADEARGSTDRAPADEGEKGDIRPKKMPRRPPQGVPTQTTVDLRSVPREMRPPQGVPTQTTVVDLTVPEQPRGSARTPQVKIMSMGALKPGLLRGGGQLQGFENAQGKLNNVAHGKGRGKGRGPLIAPGLVEDVVRLAGLEFARPRDQVVVVDARPFHDPDVDSHDHYHIGLQPKKVEAVVRHDKFPDILWATLVGIKSAMQAVTEDGAILVVVYCRKGVHRSVSFAYILRKLLLLQSTQLGMEVLETYHASARVLWARGYCNECRDCRMHSARRDAAIEKARTVWQQVNPFTD